MNSKLTGKRTTDIYISLMLSFFILFTGWSGYIRIAMKKYFCFAILTAAWLVLLIVSERRTIKDSLKAGQEKICPAVWIALLFCASCTVSACLSTHPQLTGFYYARYDGLITYILYALLFLGVYLWGELKERHLLLFFGAYCICCVLILLQLAGVNPLWLYPNHLNYYDPFIREVCMFVGTIGNEDVASALHCLAIPMACCTLERIGRRWRFVSVAAVLLGLACVVLSGSDGGRLALCATAVIGLPFAVAYKRGGGKKRYLIASAAVVLVVAIVIAAICVIPAESGTLWELQEMLRGRVDDSFGSNRIRIWREAWQAFREHPVFGIGPCCFAEYNDIEFSRYSEALGETLTVSIDNAHNEYLQHLVSFGIAGLVAPIIGLILTLRKRNHSVLFPAIFCYLLQAFFNLGLPIVTPVFLIFCALSLNENNYSN